MKKILLIDYYGMCDEKGRAVGHSPKVLEEYGELLRGEYEISIAVSPCLLSGIGETKEIFKETYELRYNIYIKGGMSIIKRSMDKVKLFFNIFNVLKIDGYDVYWFYKTDFFLFFFFFVWNLKRWKVGNQKKFIAQIYQGSFGEGRVQKLLNWCYRKGMSGFDGIIYSQKQMPKLHPNMLYFPDYYYDANKYAKYTGIRKKDKVVCLGMMNAQKELNILIDVFRHNGYPLEIKGYFYDKNFYAELNHDLPPNILLEDKLLTEENYYKTLAEAKYVVLPYDMKVYHCRTSGVLIESLFVDTVAIAPSQLLTENEIDGIGYQDIEELRDVSIFERGCMPYSSNKKKDFDKEELRRKLRDFIDCLS